MERAERIGKRVAVLGMAVSGVLAAVKITVGLKAGSTAVVSDGIESAADVFASGIVLLGLMLASRPPDADHPYGHGRFETLAGLAVGLMLVGTGVAICVQSMIGLGTVHQPASYAIWPLVGSIVAKAGLFGLKSYWGRRIHSDSLQADSWNDGVDVLSALIAMIGVGLAIWNPARFYTADHYGAFAVGLIVIGLGLRVIHDTALQLVDTMPDESRLMEIRRVALSIPGALGIEKCYARKTGLRYHVDLHLEVDPDLTVRDSHEIATQVRIRIKEELEWVADVLVHVEPYSMELANSQRQTEIRK